MWGRGRGHHGWGFCFPSSCGLRRILDQKSGEKGASDLEESRTWFWGKGGLYLLWEGPLGGNGPCSDIVVDFGRSLRRDYIVAKYVEHRFARRSAPEPQRLRTAICNRDLPSVLEAFANGQDFGQLLPGPEGQVRTASKGHLHPSCFLTRLSPGPAISPSLPTTSDICSDPTQQRGEWDRALQSRLPGPDSWLSVFS